MLAKFKPTWLRNSIYDVTPAFLLANHITHIFTDLDNTLMPWNLSEGDAKLQSWINEMKKNGIKVVVVSNNSEKRIKKAVSSLNVPFVSRALKPLTVGIDKTRRQFHVDRESVVMIGDQLMTDVFGANNARVRSILVKPIVTNDAWNTKLNRLLEKGIFNQLSKKYPDTKWH
ncbi:YqeG family HAD IIIA-type phosphatase [Lentilactobacillus sp. Marseille-Q4993]|uniref:YqeG family HAD IIIA-type phosphatase n=1 Tax=Lentilactobacillus sp. Marseille-Q4993 TaxID=3039492 RepID=UPI0024BCFCFD|nr:YqeG family HAD IIIA-type phosphatase [Lentilactobacillus sp. Marseille-Q4993]